MSGTSNGNEFIGSYKVGSYYFNDLDDAMCQLFRERRITSNTGGIEIVNVREFYTETGLPVR